MKKQTLFYILGGVAIALAITAIILVICLFPKDSGAEPFDIKGTWVVYGGANSTGNEEYMVFDEAKVSLYREKNNAYFTSDYTYEGDYINVTGLNTEFYFKQDSSTSFFMIKGDVTCYKLLKVKEAFPTFDSQVLQKNWELVEKAGHAEANQTLVFNASTITYTKDGQENTFDFVWDNENTFSVEALSSSFEVYVLDEKVVHLIQSINGQNYVWKLETK